MYGDGRSAEFIEGVRYFLKVVEANKRNGFMCCPCGACRMRRITLLKHHSLPPDSVGFHLRV
jgi:hypothetical protein